MFNLLKNKIILPFIDLLKQGVSPEMLALSIATGFVIGIIPFIGVSTAICAILAVVLRLNMVSIQLMNYTAYPLQLILYVPFIKAGEKILGLTSSGFTIKDILRLFESGFINALRILWVANLQGLFAWIIISIPVFLIIYYISLLLLRRFNPADIIEN